jgi:hypothetical protein
LLYGSNDNVLKVKTGEKVIIERYQDFMRDKILHLRKLNLDSVSAQAALIESRNYFFNNNLSANPSSIIEASLYKEFDTNMLENGLAKNVSDYTELAIKDSLGMSFKEFMDLPIYYKKTLTNVLRQNILAKPFSSIFVSNSLYRLASIILLGLADRLLLKK